MSLIENEKQENAIAFVHIFRNMLAALFNDDPEFKIYVVDQPLPDGTIDVRPGEHTLNIVCSNVAKLTILRAHLGDTYENGEILNLDYYYGNPDAESASKEYQEPNTSLDMAMLFEGNPHFSKFYSGMSQFGPWFCVAFKPELIQYYTNDATALHGRRSCAMEDIARTVFADQDDQCILFSTENIEDFNK